MQFRPDPCSYQGNNHINGLKITGGSTMKKCIGCEMEFEEAIEICTECGEPVAEFGEASDPDFYEETSADVSEADEQHPHLVLENGERLELKAGDAMLGRLDPIEGIHPDIDLTGYRGFDLGVSRKHAVILKENEEYLLEDLGSANGTIVNSERAEPGVRIPLSEGDTIYLGRLKATFHTFGGDGGTV